MSAPRRTRRPAVLAAVVGLRCFAWFIEPRTEWESPLEGRERVPVRVRFHRLTGERQNQGGAEGPWGHFVW